MAWVPVVPQGNATTHLSWKRWVWLQNHIGVFGAHRSAQKTIILLLRLVWWATLTRDVEQWTESCMTCIRYRQRPTRPAQIAVKPLDCDCWSEVMIDFEGPSNPPDRQGCRYVLTYFCCLSHGVLLEPVKHLRQSEVRRALSKCMFRSGRLPELIRSDRGPEFKNTVMAEFTSLVGLKHKFGAPWRPVEQARVERIHQEVQKILGNLTQEVCKSFPDEWTELLPVVEFTIYNTPGPHGFSPRDLDRRWSLGTGLEKALQPFQVLDFEPISEWASTLFAQYKKVRELVINHMANSSADRAQLANRFRKVKKNTLVTVWLLETHGRERLGGGLHGRSRSQTHV